MSLRFLILALAGLLCGCGGPVILPEEESQPIRMAVASALDAWKGESLPALTERTPAIRFTDDDLSDGFRLATYTFSGEPQRSETGVTEVRASLSLIGNDDSRIERSALYQVTQEEIISILRVE